MSTFDPVGVAKGWAATVDAACRMLKEAQTGMRGDGPVKMVPLADLLGVGRTTMRRWRKGRAVCQDGLTRRKIQALAAQWRAIEDARAAARLLVEAIEAA